MPDLDDFEQAVVDQWAQTHKRSALVHVVMVALEGGPRWSGELLELIEQVTGGEWSVDDRSLYRALRRLERSEMVIHVKEDAPGTGAQRKVFDLTPSGRRVLAAYEEQTLGYLPRLDALRTGAVITTV